MNLTNEIRLTLTGHSSKVADVLAKKPELVKKSMAAYDEMFNEIYSNGLKNDLNNHSTPSNRR